MTFDIENSVCETVQRLMSSRVVKRNSSVRSFDKDDRDHAIDLLCHDLCEIDPDKFKSKMYEALGIDNSQCIDGSHVCNTIAMRIRANRVFIYNKSGHDIQFCITCDDTKKSGEVVNKGNKIIFCPDANEVFLSVWLINSNGVKQFASTIQNRKISKCCDITVKTSHFGAD